MKETCENCRYWVNGQEFSSGTCQRYPPIKNEFGDGEMRPVWIGSNWNDWCGEWRVKDEASIGELHGL